MSCQKVVYVDQCIKVAPRCEYDEATNTLSVYRTDWVKIKADHDSSFRKWLGFEPSNVKYGCFVLHGRCGILVYLTDAQCAAWKNGDLKIGPLYTIGKVEVPVRVDQSGEGIYNPQ